MEKKARGGARRNAGRKTERPGDPAKVRSVSLDDMTVRKLRVVGGGNVSKGIRLAAELAYLSYQEKGPE